MDIDQRSFERISIHYELEKKLAKKLLNSNKVERKSLYSSLYDELFKKLPDHPQLVRKASAEESQQYVDGQLLLLKRFIKKDSTFLEVGPGDCSLSYSIARDVNKVYAIDVSNEITKDDNKPQNFELILSDGSSIPVPNESVDIAYSNQLMEHLHPDDALEQLNNLYKSLKVGGKYICITPNSLSGPHDISMYFDNQATGFHLKEYTNKELVTLFKDSGFKKTETYIGGKGLYLKVPTFLMLLLEGSVALLPTKISKGIARASRGILQNCQIIGTK